MHQPFLINLAFTVKINSLVRGLGEVGVMAKMGWVSLYRVGGHGTGLGVMVQGWESWYRVGGHGTTLGVMVQGWGSWYRVGGHGTGLDVMVPRWGSWYKMGFGVPWYRMG
jgi:hypothetical protein